MRTYFMLGACMLFAACNQEQTAAPKKVENALLRQFNLQEIGKDSLKFSTNSTEFLKDSTKLKKLSDTLLSRHLDAAEMENLNFTGSGEYWAGNQIALNDSNIACVIYTKDNWFKKTSFLIYNTKKNTFPHVIPVAEYYGGESGLTYQVSWLYKNAKNTYLFHRNIDVAFGVVENGKDEPIEKRVESNSLEKWEKGEFVKENLIDSLRVCSKFKHTED